MAIFPEGYGPGTCFSREHTDFLDRLEPLLAALDQRVTAIEQGEPAFSIASFGTAVGVQEVGAEVTSPAFTASYSRAPTSAAVVDNQGNPSENVILTPEAFSYPHNYTKTANNDQVGFTLTAAFELVGGTKTASIAWRPRCHWGVGLAGIVDQAGIEGLASDGLMASRAHTFSASPGASEYVYYAFPESYGAASFFVDGWEGGFDLISAAIPMTNGYGVTQNYRLYRSTNAGLGLVTVQVV